MINKIFFVLVCVFFLPACNYQAEKKIAAENLKAEMIAAENSFSALGQKVGARKALMQFIDSNGVLLKPNNYPLLGAEAIDFISQSNDSAYSIIWQPKGGTVAASGELGYTYGVYTITPKNKDKVIYGTYVNIWKKQADGSWKIMLNSGNEGIEN